MTKWRHFQWGKAKGIPPESLEPKGAQKIFYTDQIIFDDLIEINIKVNFHKYQNISWLRGGVFVEVC